MMLVPHREKRDLDLGLPVRILGRTVDAAQIDPPVQAPAEGELLRLRPGEMLLDGFVELRHRPLVDHEGDVLVPDVLHEVTWLARPRAFDWNPEVDAPRGLGSHLRLAVHHGY